MKHQGKRLITLTSALAVLILPNLAVGATYYVDTAGDDVANDCSVQALPCKTITHAFTQVPAGTSGDPSVIMVAAGLYDESVNGEDYPLYLFDDYISLVGAGSGTTTIDVNVAGIEALNINGTGFSVSGFTFSNVPVGLAIYQGGFTVSNNNFTDTVTTGVYSSLEESSPSTSATVGPVSFTNNQFACSGNGVNFSIGLTFDGTTTGLSATVGNITVTGNTFVDTGFMLNELSIRGMDTGTATVGNITATGNTFTDCGNGIQLDELYVDNMVDTSITVGNVYVSNNTFTDNFGTAIYVDYFDVRSLYGNSSTTLGDLLVQNNTIEADAQPVSGYGIYISDIGHIINIYDTSTVTTGSVTISGNSVESYGQALYVQNYGIYNIGVDGGTDTAMVSFGPTSITNNPKLSSTDDYGVYLDIDYLGYDQYGQTKVDVGLITVNNNTITSANDYGLYMYYYYESGYYMDDDAQLDIAGLTFTNNRITSTDYYGVYFYLYGLGYDMNGNSKMTVGPTTITGNTITSYYEALYFDFDDYIAYEMYDSSIFTMDPWTISNNTLTTTDSADYGALTIYYYDYYVGSYMEDDSSATLPNWAISNNKIDVNGGYNGIYYYTYSNPDDNYGNAAVHYGSMLIDNNIFNENKDAGMDRAIDFLIEDVCEDCYDSSTFSHGDITITNNTIYNVEDTGINVEYDDVGYAFDNDGKATMGNVTIADNLIDTAPYGIYAGYAGIESEASAVVTLGTLDITGNTVKNITEEGIRFDISASIDVPTAALTIGKTTISDNTVTASASPGAKSAGIWIDGEIGENVVFAAPEVSSNTVTGFGVGIGLDDLPEATISCNTVKNNSDFGLFFLSDGTFTAVYNTLIDNGLGLKVEDGATATVTAEDNWWGDAAGPVACASCNKIDAGGGSVDYDPWLTSRPRSQCGGFPWVMFMPAITAGINP